MPQVKGKHLLEMSARGSAGEALASKAGDITRNNKTLRGL